MRRRRRKQQLDSDDDNDGNNDKTPTKLPTSHHTTLRAPLRGHGRMSLTAVYPQDASPPFKNAVMDRKRGNDTVGNGKGKEKDPWKIVGSCVEAPEFHIIAKQECLRRFGSEKKTRKFKGVVIQSYSLKNRVQSEAQLMLKPSMTWRLQRKGRRRNILLFKW